MLNRRVLLGATGAAVLAQPAIVKAQSGPIRVASVGPMTGQYAAFGTQLRIGAEAAVEALNGAGGVLGRQLALEIGDDACDPRQAVSVANQMAARRVRFIAGHFCSGSSIPARDVYAEEGVLQMSPASTNPAFTDQGKWNTFRVCGRDDQQGQVAGGHIARTMGDQRVAILHDNTAYGRGLAEETKKAMNAAGKQEDIFSAYTPGERDYSAIVSRLQAGNIQVLYIGGYHTESGLILRQARERGLNLQLIGGDALVTNEFWQITGPVGEGTLMTFASDPRRRPTAAPVVARFRANNVDPEGYVLYTYAAMQIWAAAVTRTGSDDPRRVAATLKSGGPWASVLGETSFTDKGDPTVPDYVFYRWSNGAYAEIA